MNNEIIIYIAFGIILILTYIFNYIKDKESIRKFNKFELVLESLIKENYELKKLILEQGDKENNIQIESKIDMEDILKHVDLKVGEVVNSKVIPILDSLKGIEHIIGDFQNEQQNRLYNLEERTKTITKITPPSFDTEENRIIELYNMGKSIESIARDLRLGVGRVNMVLKFHKVI